MLDIMFYDFLFCRKTDSTQKKKKMSEMLPNTAKGYGAMCYL
jgi:hypothetical protein